MTKQTPAEPPPVGVRLARRHVLRAAGLVVHTLAAPGAWVAPGLSVAQRPAAENKPADPPLPAVGSHWRLSGDAIKMLDGSELEVSTLDQAVLVIYWWASWCPFCAVQSPHVDALWRKHRQQGLRVLGLSVDARSEDASAYLQRKGYAFPSAWLGPALRRAWPKPEGLPVLVVRGRNGRVLMAESGQLFPEDIEQIARFL